MNPPLYHVSNLEHRYGDKVVLEINELFLDSGKIIGLVGPNGSGKSTLLRILAFIEPPTQGTLRFSGRPVDSATVELRRQVSLLLQEPVLLQRDVFANVAYGLKARGQTDGLEEKVHQALRWVGLDPLDFAARPWNRLSGGEAQRVALASRLALKPKVLLLDEPTSSLDLASAALIMEAVNRARREWGASLVIASHDLIWLYAICDRVINLHQGRLMDLEAPSFIPGPWHPAAHDGLWQNQLAGGQTITAPAMPAGLTPSIATAALEPASLSISLEPPPSDFQTNRLAGVITQLILEHTSNQILVQTAVDRLSFMIRVSPQEARVMALQPGLQIWLRFPLEAMTWL